MLKEVDLDVFQIRDQPFPLPVKAADVRDAAIAPQWQSELADHLAKNRHHVRLHMRVLVRINVRRHAARQFHEAIELTAKLIADALLIRKIERAFVLAKNVPMQADTEGWMSARQ